MLTVKDQNKGTKQSHQRSTLDTYEPNAILRRRIALLFAIAIIIYPFIALIALIIIIYLAKNIDVIRLLPLILSPIGVTGGFYLIAKRMFPVDPDWLLLEQEKLRLQKQVKDENKKKEST